MRIAVFGATGRIGSRTVSEALARGHEVTAVVRRDPDDAALAGEGLRVVAGDVLDAASVAAAAAGAGVAISALGGAGERPGLHRDAAAALLDGLARAGVPRLLVVGGAASLEVAPGRRVLDDPEFPAAWMPEAQSQADALAFYREADTTVAWTYLSPAFATAPGERRGRYRTGADALLRDDEGNSEISMEDVAVALIDEAERPAHPRARFTIAY